MRVLASPRPVAVTAALLILAIAGSPALLPGQNADSSGKPPQPGTLQDDKEKVVGTNPAEEEPKRLFGIIPNYRTSPSLVPYKPLSTGEKFKLATQDSFDRGTFILAAAFAGEGQLTNANRSFGQGAAGYGRYLGTAYADFVIGDYMTEAIFPSLLHQDPRYFRRGTGSTPSRLWYAISQIFITHNDSGRTFFNASEILGNSTAVAISNAYYADNRDVPDAITKLGSQLGVDMGANIIKEFSPDIYHLFGHKQKK